MLKIITAELPECNVLILRGEILMDNEKEFRDKVYDLYSKSDLPIVIDMKNVDFVDSAGLGTLINMMYDFIRRGRPLKIHRPSPMVESLIDSFIHQ